MRSTKFFISIVLALFSILLIGNRRVVAATQIGDSPDPQADLVDMCLGGGAVAEFNQQTNLLSFVGTDGGPIPRLAGTAAADSPEAAGFGYFSACGSLFGLENANEELRLTRLTYAEDDRRVLRYQKMFNGVDVFAGQLVMQLTPTNDVVMVSGEVQPALDVNAIAQLSKEDARQAAVASLSSAADSAAGDVEVTEPELLVYVPALIGADGEPALVWRVEVMRMSSLPVNRLIFVNAQDGSIALDLDQLHTGKVLETYDANNGTNLGSAVLVCDNSDPTCIWGDTDAKNAHIYASDTYDFYLAQHGRDSIDNLGMTLKSYTHYSSGWCNASWSGVYNVMLYGDGCVIVADDVVAHELTHGVTDYESDLVYAYQSGAINESLSDTWGEFVDLTNGRGTDTAGTRWQIGEDAFAVIRDMEDPTLYSDPDRMGSPFYYTGSNDNGGVHTNSGVGNKATFLITDGGSFNGYNISGLGIDLAAMIYYEVQTNILTSGSDYADLGRGLIQACRNLIGTNGLTALDCRQVIRAVYATEMLESVPTLISPANIYRDRTPEYTWTREENVARYRIEVYQNGSLILARTLTNDFCGPVQCSFTPAGVLDYDVYDWRVRSQVAGVWGPWSFFRSYNLAPPDPLSPTDQVLDRTPEYRWTEEKDATHYQFQVYQGATKIFTQTVDNSACQGGECSFTPATQLDYKTYKWRVRAKAGGIWGKWSDSYFQQFSVVRVLGFNSTFNGSMSGWEIVDGDWTIHNDKFLKATGFPYDHVSANYRLSNFSDLTYQVRMYRPDCDNCANGIYVRGNPWTFTYPNLWFSGYYFAYTNDGMFSVYLMQDTIQTTLKDWTVSPAINQGGWNTLKVTAKGSTLRFFINDVLVWAGTNTDLSTGKVGITMYSETGDVLYTDWAKLWVPSTASFAAEDNYVLESGQVEVGGGTIFKSPEQ